MTVSVHGGPFGGVSAATIRRRALKMMSALDLAGVDLSVALVDDRIIRELNRCWRGRDRPTDVLAFAMREGEPLDDVTVEPLGDVIISVPTAVRQARRRRRSVLDELTMLLAHGLLHLLGYDHATAAQEREMTAKARVLQSAARRGERHDRL